MNYRLGDLFAIRPTGVAFEVLEASATPAISDAARAVLDREAALKAAIVAAGEALDGADIAHALRRKLRRKVYGRAALPDGAPPLPALEAYASARAAVATAEATLEDVFAREDDASIERIFASAARELPDFAVVQLTSGALANMLASRTRKHARSLATWLQRVASKNDTISRFGPSWWGRVDREEPGLRIAPEPGIGARRAWIERWVVHALIALIDEDPEVRPELAPRIDPRVELRERRALRHDTGVEIELSSADLVLLARCDGKRAAYDFDADQLASLVERGVVIWRLEPLFIDADPLSTLIADVAAWRDGAAKQRWSARLAELVKIAEAYAATTEPTARLAVLARANELFETLGVSARRRTGRLYEATNPIVEECARAGDFTVGQKWVDVLMAESAPWLDFFRDANSVAALVVYAGLRELYLAAPRVHGRLSLAAFAAYAQTKGSGLNEMIYRLAHGSFRDIRAGFARALSTRAEAPEWQLSREDFRFLDGPNIPRPALACASMDLQVAATSQGAVARGDFRWVISELHTGFALMGQALTWSCPDPARLAALLRANWHDQPALYMDSAAASYTPVHVSTESVLDALERVTVAACLRTRPHWSVMSPTEVDVILDEERGDLRGRCIRTGADLGTLFPLPRFAYHPFFPLQLPRDTPRLVIGRTVLQRRNWVITRDELGGPFPDRSAALARAIEKLRAARGLPRHVFFRLRDEILSTVDDANRLKDVKPMYIDLESSVLSEVFARRLDKYGEVELAEMLPAPEELVWGEPDGHRCFEMRAMVVPAEGT